MFEILEHFLLLGIFLCLRSSRSRHTQHTGRHSQTTDEATASMFRRCAVLIVLRGLFTESCGYFGAVIALRRQTDDERVRFATGPFYNKVTVWLSASSL
jgi:hypothetical protein